MTTEAHLDTPALPGMEDLAPDPGPPSPDRGPHAIERYERARIAEENRRAGSLPVPGARKVSRGRALTRVRQALIAAGYHPLTRLPLLEDPPEATCGTCAHLLGAPGSWRKCGKHRRTAASETDVVLSWPACTLWEAADV